MKAFLKLLNTIQFLNMFLFIPYIIIGEDLLLFKTYSRIGEKSGLIANQSSIFITITLIFVIYAKIKKIALYSDLTFIINTCSKTIIKIVIVSLMICLCLEIALLDNDSLYGYVIVSCLNAIAVLFCNSIINRRYVY